MSENKVVEYRIEPIAGRGTSRATSFRLHLKFADGTRYMLAKLSNKEISVLLTKHGMTQGGHPQTTKRFTYGWRNIIGGGGGG